MLLIHVKEVGCPTHTVVCSPTSKPNMNSTNISRGYAKHYRVHRETWCGTNYLRIFRFLIGF